MQNKKIISDVIITKPKEKLAQEIFRQPEPVFKDPNKSHAPHFRKFPGIAVFLVLIILAGWMLNSEAMRGASSELGCRIQLGFISDSMSFPRRRESNPYG